MEIIPTTLKDSFILKPKIHEDNRGFFFEAFNSEFISSKLGTNISFVQYNHSKSKRNVLRGLHYQLPPMDQGKLVSVIKGEIYDVLVDLRKSSSSYKKSTLIKVSEKCKKSIWIPPGFAHGFLSISDDTEIIYLTTNIYSKKHEMCIKYDDLELGIKWPGQKEEYIISEKDRNGFSFSDIITFP